MEDQESLLGNESNGWSGTSGIANAYQYASRNKRQTGFWRISLILPCFILATLFLAPLYIMNNKVQPKNRHMELRNVVGYFMQDDQYTDAKTFSYSTTNFGLKDREYDTDPEFDPERKKTQWERFENHIMKLNHQTPHNVQYKVLYLGRHGEGYHNIKETEVGKDAWDCYWSHLNGDENSTWADSHLAPTGVAQALVANDFWEKLITTQKISPPQSYYVSPLTRCLETCSLTFSNLTLPPSSPPFIPTIKELLREGISSHTCDRRRSRSYIHTFAPTWNFESNFSEEDPYWRANYSETHEAENRRFKALLGDIFLNDNSTFISLSSHSGAINAILRVIGHRTFPLKTGAVIPVVIKGQYVLGEDPNPIYKGPTLAQDPKVCSAPPSPSETPKPVNDIGLKKPGDVVPPPEPPAASNPLAEANPPTEANPPANVLLPTEVVIPAPIAENPAPTEQILPQNIEVNPPPAQAAPPVDTASNSPPPPPQTNQNQNQNLETNAPPTAPNTPPNTNPKTPPTNPASTPPSIIDVKK